MTEDESKAVLRIAAEMFTTDKHNRYPLQLPHWEGEIMSAKEFFGIKED